MEASESRISRSQHDTETSSLVIQMHCLHSDVRHVQAIWKSRLLGSQHSRQERQQEQKLDLNNQLIKLKQFAVKAAENQRWDYNYSTAGETFKRHGKSYYWWVQLEAFIAIFLNSPFVNRLKSVATFNLCHQQIANEINYWKSHRQRSQSSHFKMKTLHERKDSQINKIC